MSQEASLIFQNLLDEKKEVDKFIEKKNGKKSIVLIFCLLK